MSSFSKFKLQEESSSWGELGDESATVLSVNVFLPNARNN